jgi:anti-sigma factor RsiW
MKEARFIELLNLYVDQEISPEESRELEAEILRHPARRRLYGQYCRMQRACVTLFESENRQAPPVQMAKLLAAARAADDKVALFPGPASFAPAAPPVRGVAWWPRLAWGAAMAACLALALTVSWQQLASPGEADTLVATAPAAEAPRAEVSAPAVRVATLASESVSPVMLRRSDSPPASADAYPQFISTWRNLASATWASIEHTPEAPSLEWMRGLEFAPIYQATPEQLRFESRSAFPAGGEPRTFRGRAAGGFQTEMSAFQFQR